MHTLSIAATRWRRTHLRGIRRRNARAWRARGYLRPRAAHIRHIMKQRVHRATRRRTRAFLRGTVSQLHQKG